MVKRKPQEEVNTGAWMNTYADLVTLLLCFFVLLYSMSQIDAEKWEAFVKAFANPGDDTAQVVLDAIKEANPSGAAPDMGVSGRAGSDDRLDLDNPQPVDLSELYRYLEMYVNQNNMEQSVELVEGEGAVFIRFKNNIFFGADSSILADSAREILDFIGDCLKPVEEQIALININGHTALAHSSYRIKDWTLSSERAGAVAVYLEEQKGVSSQKLRPIGYGGNYPIASNDTTEGRGQNRRVDLVIVGSELLDEDSAMQAFADLVGPDPFATGGVSSILKPADEEKYNGITNADDAQTGEAAPPDDPGDGATGDESLPPGADG